MCGCAQTRPPPARTVTSRTSPSISGAALARLTEVPQIKMSLNSSTPQAFRGSGASARFAFVRRSIARGIRRSNWQVAYEPRLRCVGDGVSDHKGSACGGDTARVLEDHGIADFIGLTRLIAGAEVSGFEWHNAMWITMFQFAPCDLSVNPAARQVLKELGVGFDGRSCAAWFARPNSWLNNRAPVDLATTQLTEVFEAAGTDRFIAGT